MGGREDVRTRSLRRSRVSAISLLVKDSYTPDSFVGCGSYGPIYAEGYSRARCRTVIIKGHHKLHFVNHLPIVSLLRLVNQLVPLQYLQNARTMSRKFDRQKTGSYGRGAGELAIGYPGGRLHRTPLARGRYGGHGVPDRVADYVRWKVEEHAAWASAGTGTGAAT